MFWSKFFPPISWKIDVKQAKIFWEKIDGENWKYFAHFFSFASEMIDNDNGLGPNNKHFFIHFQEIT